jgi:predicted DNA-binding transcriptional regulator AlpA
MAKNKAPAAPVVVTRSGRERFLTDNEVAGWLGTTTATLAVWRCTHRYPLPYIKLGRLVRYRESDVLTFLESRLVKPAVVKAR